MTVAAAAMTVLTLAGCSLNVATSTTGGRRGDPATAGHAPNGLVYSHASASQVQEMPKPGSCHYRGHGLYVKPDPRCTPGALNVNVNQANLARTICRPGGYTESVRPPESVTEREKHAAMAAYGADGRLSRFELDHVVPLSLGGAVNDPRNLYPEPDYPGASSNSFVRNPKDRLEDKLFELACARRILLARAQALIARDWVAAYNRYIVR